MSNLSVPPAQWMRELFEFEFCHECGGDAQHHYPLPVMGNWFAMCKFTRDEETGELHPTIAAYRAEQDAT